MPTFYDYEIDARREVTQADVDALVSHSQAFGRLYTGIKAMAEDARLQALGKLKPLDFEQLIRDARDL